MTLSKVPWGIGVATLVVAVGVPLLAHWLRRPVGEGCDLDGAKINPEYRVEVVDHAGRRRIFCCVRCAQIWLGRQASPPRSVVVTDEPSRQGIDAADAIYVRSMTVTTPTTGNRIHVFRNPADAENHAAQHRGTILTGSERPLP